MSLDKYRDNKEISFFIDQLNSTLNAANKYDSEVDIEDDIQEETIDDIEKDVIAAERYCNEEEERNRADRGDGEDGEELTPRNQPRKPGFIYDNEKDEDVRFKKDREPFAGGDSAQDDNERTLGATNHMKDRIRDLEK